MALVCAGYFPVKNSFDKYFKIFFFALASRSGFGASISDAFAFNFACIFFGFSKSVSADHIVMAVTRLLGAATACAILLAFAARHRKSYYGVAA